MDNKIENQINAEAYEVNHVTIKLQASPEDLEEKACPKCKSIAVEKIKPRRRSGLL